MVGDNPTTAVAERNPPVRVLGYQGVVPVRAILSRLSLASDVCVLILLTPLRFEFASDYYSEDCLRLLWPRCHGLQQFQRDCG